jgi:D-alanyl-D-alanine carboxypeptidase
MQPTTHHASKGRATSYRLVAGALAGLALLLTVTAAAASSPAASTSRTKLKTDLKQLVAAGTPGAILLVRDGNHTTSFTAGFGDLSHKTPMRGDNHFKIASLTKTYTATAVLQLVQNGKLRLRDTVERWLPKLVPNGRHITVHMLLNHTSGLADFEDNPRYYKPYLSGNFGYYTPPRQLVRLSISQKPHFAPGARHEYSNTNYVVAQLIVEKITGNGLGIELKRRIFQPLGLTETSYPTKPGLPSPYAHGYRLFNKPPLIDVSGLSPSLAPGSGAIFSTTRDVADFYRALLTGRVLQPDMLKAMKTTVPASVEELGASGYGLGLVKWRTGCGPAWGHDGGIPGYWTRSYSSEDGRRQAVLMTNQDADTLAVPARAAFLRLIVKAYCNAG